jgi:hypothetical protein
MDMFGHHDVPGQNKPISIAHFAQNIDEGVSGSNRAQQRQALVTTKCDEVEMVLPVSALQPGRHEYSNQDPPLKSVKDGAP